MGGREGVGSDSTVLRGSCAGLQLSSLGLMSSFVVLEVSEASDAGFSPLFKRSSRNAFLGCGGFSLGCSGSRH